ncbi:MAG TPA: bifunctional UDP-N-acetylglucosamine diphosphorylase/glucosamine-1-phosphate N-acetyltransferase GlmU [Thermoleophilaceae bacterium]|nr:bifunctional UDP-N-acetylglucosamine diphosphorylase/glucosamine-1-phosphate N-acetyltransferase GlmU [Thermoleophilaceae bacterium]
MPEPFTVLIMAAGRGTRMRSETPKVLHRVCGKPMVEWVIDAALAAGAARVVCVVRPGDGVAQGLPESVSIAEQHEGEGTGAAVLAARDATSEGPVVVLSGDHPLVTPEQIAGLVQHHRDQAAGLTVLTTEQLDPAGYGRIVRNSDGDVERIVETKYTEGVPPDELAIEEINLGTYVFEAPRLFEALDQVELVNGERYLTNVLPVLKADGARVIAHPTHDPSVAVGINDRAGLMQAEALAQRRILERHARDGVTFLHPGSVRVEARAAIGADTTIGPGVSLIGDTSVGGGSEIGPHTTLVDCRVGHRATVLHTYAVEVEIHDDALIGPFAYLRPGTVVRDGAKVGTFVEVKNSDIGELAKVPHLSYLGDADVGDRANLGASTITANYDGRSKHRTKLGKSVKTGVHTSLVAPLDVGDRAYTGAGSVITGDVPEGALGISRSDQKNVEGYADRVEEDST